MKLYAVVDKDGKELHRIPVATEEAAWFLATLSNQRRSLAQLPHEGIKGVLIEEGCKIKELHTYDPATHVVVDRGLYENICEGIALYGKDWPETRSHAIKQFLSAGKEK